MTPNESDSSMRAGALRPSRSFVSDARLRADPFALPTETPFRFTLLVVAVFASTAFTWNLLYDTFNGARWYKAYRSCGADTPLPSDPGSAKNAVRDRAECMAAVDQEIGYWIVAGMLLLLLVALAVYWLTPWWRVRRGQLEEPDSEDAADVLAELDRLRHVAGVGRVRFLWQPLKAAPAAFAFGRPGDRKIALSGGLVVRFHRDRSAFRAVVLHELAHLRNRDVDQAYGAVAAWRAFSITSFLPFVAVELWHRDSLALRAGWRFVVLALLVYLLRNAVLRSRELYADARVQSWDQGVPLFGVLGGMPAGGSHVRRWLAMHPAPVLRQQALADPTPLFRLGFWEAFGIGLVATLAIPQIRLVANQLVSNFVSPNVFWSVLIVAFLAAAALVIGVWRMRFPDTLVVEQPVWPIGVGFAIGSAIGPLLALTEGSGALRLSVTALLLWLLLSVVALGPLPSWIAEGALSWLARPTTGARRRIAYLVAVTLTSLVLILLMSWLQFQNIGAGQTAAAKWSSIWQSLENDYFVGLSTVAGREGLIVALLVLAVAAYILVGQVLAGGPNSHLSPPTEVGLSSTGHGRKSWPLLRPVLFTGLAAGLMAITLVLIMRLVAHAQVSAQVRANWRFIVSFGLFHQRAIIVLAVVGGLLVTAATVRMPLARGALTALVASLVGTLGFVFQGTVSSCVPAMALRPSTGCPANFPGWSYFWQSLGLIMGTAEFLTLLLAPVVAAAASFVRSRTLGRRRAFAYSARRLRTLKVGSLIVTLVAFIPVSFAAVDKSSNGLQDAGRITGPGYQLNLFPDWSNVTQQLLPTTPRLLQAFRADTIEAQMMVVIPPAPWDTASLQDLHRAGGRPGTLDGAPTATFDPPASTARRIRLTLVLHDQRRYLIQLACHPRDFSQCESAAQLMLHSWHWR